MNTHPKIIRTKKLAAIVVASIFMVTIGCERDSRLAKERAKAFEIQSGVLTNALALAIGKLNEQTTNRDWQVVVRRDNKNEQWLFNFTTDRNGHNRIFNVAVGDSGKTFVLTNY